ncbi:hypothetical protein [Methylobacterium haplocladii]|uniref:Lipoprotein n=1 Tax=Methylobacterium haplocladii TaxID=1176176 RepID=A0A512IT26_9HYPH|nr:hypothetical protein [Methylobacterium haplocladii]GEP00857.1 hypothetical protein MHA02_32440 [Methylobacterium haplocladii]GJD86163.1 hypothetical protein HPGCJGGD_4060 [Methylobacterium haplocladii]GLS60207.1 hypothetical protein GCM10007887_28850 [Methylobacterium haplocladii]
MRVTIGVAVLLAGCAGAAAQDTNPELRRSGGLSPLRAAPSTVPQANEEALNRQVAMDKRMDARTRRVIGSVCLGCGGGPERRRSGGRATATAPSEIQIADPAEAPLD